MSKEDFVSFEQAQKLKALGFVEETTHYYNDDGTFEEQSIYIEPSLDGRAVSVSYVIDGGFNKHCSTAFDAPTLSQACKWLRSKGWAVQTYLIGTRTAYFARVWKLEMNSDVVDVAGQFDTYEQAQSAGIDVAIGLLEKGDK